MFKEELEDLKNRYLTRLTLHHGVLARGTGRAADNGRLDEPRKLGEFLAALVPADTVDHAFVCGPHRHERRGRGRAARGRRAGGAHPHRALRRRPTRPAGAAACSSQREADAPQVTLVIIRDGLSREIEFRTRATQHPRRRRGRRAGSAVSCKSGVCSTCRAKLVEGEVRMDRNFALERHEVAAGFVLTCQAHPLTERVVLSFDER